MSDPVRESWSTAALEDVADRSVLVINPFVFTEVSIGFERIEHLEEALPSDIAPVFRKLR
jgi:hypothetical protein